MDGIFVGLDVGRLLGIAVGSADGFADGLAVGTPLGDNDGNDVVGELDGESVNAFVRTYVTAFGNEPIVQSGVATEQDASSVLLSGLYVNHLHEPIVVSWSAILHRSAHICTVDEVCIDRVVMHSEPLGATGGSV